MTVDFSHCVMSHVSLAHCKFWFFHYSLITISLLVFFISPFFSMMMTTLSLSLSLYYSDFFSVENTCHSDFLLLRNLLLKENLLDLVNSTGDVIYENYRMSHFNGNTNRLADLEKSYDKACNNRFVQKILAHTRMRMHK